MKTKVLVGVIVAVVAIAAGVFLGQSTSQAPSVVEDGNSQVPDTNVAPVDDASKSIVDVIDEAISDEGVVVQDSGEPVVLDADPGSSEAPQQSAPIENVEELPSTVLKIGITSADGWTPTEFTVKSGDAVSLSITSQDDKTHIFAFSDASLSAVAVGVGPGETRAISFNAPAPGEYEFLSNMPGQTQLKGKMIVQ